jgi:hypothetical protein
VRVVLRPLALFQLSTGESAPQVARSLRLNDNLSQDWLLNQPKNAAVGNAILDELSVPPRWLSCSPEPSRSHLAPLARENLTADIMTSFQGTAAAFEQSLKGMGVLFLFLGILYESYPSPHYSFPLPSAGLGALPTLLLVHDERNLYSFVGIIMLIGIVK